MRRKDREAHRVAFLGLLFALAVCLSFLESLIPPLVAIPGMKLGLSNIVTMYAVFLLGPGYALSISALKALFALFTRGAVAASLSLCGGLASVAAMLCLLALNRRSSYGLVSMGGAVAHNLGQLAAAAWILRLDAVFWYYLPPLVVAGVGMGLVTSLLLRAVLPWLPLPGERGPKRRQLH